METPKRCTADKGRGLDWQWQKQLLGPMKKMPVLRAYTYIRARTFASWAEAGRPGVVLTRCSLLARVAPGAKMHGTHALLHNHQSRPGTMNTSGKWKFPGR
eukprot:14020111-Alexandrium_andersonii.AAC.1